MNNYHRYLKLPFEIKPPKEFEGGGDIVKHIQLAAINQPELIAPSKYLPEVGDFFEDLGLEFVRVDAFYTPPNSKIGIHTDFPMITNHVKINITWGPEEGVMRWWCTDKVKHRIIDQSNENTIDYHNNLWAEEEDCVLQWEANTNKPSLVNVGVFHSTYNPTNQKRWTICLIPMLRYDVPGYSTRLIHWDMATEIFRECIVNQ